MDCPICRAPETKSLHDRVPDFEHGSTLTASFRACSSCGVLFQYPLPTAQSLRAMYTPVYRAHQRGGPFGLLKHIQATLHAIRLRRHISTPVSTILELGCGAGHLLIALRRAGFVNLCGVDWTISADLVKSAPSIAFIEHDITSFVPPAPVDVILINNVVEHVLEPRILLERYRAYLKQGGRIILLTPNAESISRNIFGRFWSGLHSPWHMYVFTARSLSIVAGGAGFRCAAIATGEDPGAWGISVQNLFRSRWRKPNWPAGSGFGPMAFVALALCLPFAMAAKLLGKGSTLLAVLE